MNKKVRLISPVILHTSKETIGTLAAICQENSEYYPRFQSRFEDQVTDLREELGVMEDDDICFIQGDFSSYYQEREVLGEGASGVVKKCINNKTSQICAVKMVRYRGDVERLHMVKSSICSFSDYDVRL